VVVVARGGGSLADLFAFCDETLCRTVALLRVPVIASVGHHTDRTLIDDVAAVSCSTPTHAAETAVPLHCGERRAAVTAAGGTAGRARAPRRDRARPASGAPRRARRASTSARERSSLHQTLREVRASATRACATSARDAHARLALARRRGPPPARSSRPGARRSTASPSRSAPTTPSA
jgi:exodeoxyribonuclease VII large subunit